MGKAGQPELLHFHAEGAAWGVELQADQLTIKYAPELVTPALAFWKSLSSVHGILHSMNSH